MTSNIVYCADVITYHAWTGKVVIIERLASIPGLALPGGKQDPGETLWQTAVREIKEETGLDLNIKGVLGTYAEDGRDPRGRYVSTVFIGQASGKVRDEVGKTRVLTYDRAQIESEIDRFVFDHGKVMSDFLRLIWRQ